MSSKIAAAILTGGISLASPAYGRISTFGLLGEKSKPGTFGLVAADKKPKGGATSAPLLNSSSSLGGNKQGVLPVTTSPLGDVSAVSLSRGRLLGG